MAAGLILHLSFLVIAPSDFVQQDGYGTVLDAHPEDLAEADKPAPACRVRASPLPHCLGAFR